MQNQNTTTSQGRLLIGLVGIAAAVGLLLAIQVQAAPTVVQLTVPTLSTPANGATNWLFNLPTNGPRETLSWTTSLGTSQYEVVVSHQPNFSDAVDTTSGVFCSASCAARIVTGTSAKDLNFSGFWWESGTYYWRVRAIYPTSRSAWSTTRSFVTARKPDIVVQAKNYSSSPASLAAGPGRTWIDETAGGDGGRLRAAMQTYRIARDKGLGTAGQQTQLARNMIANLGGSDWSTDSKWSLISRIAATEETSPVPTTEQATLLRLGVRAQCKEFADRMVTAGGGTATSYPAVTAAGSSDPHPGMYVFRRDYKSSTGTYYWGHAAVANAIRVETDGSRSARLSEANSGSGWSNPAGEIPWQRIVLHTNAKPLSTTGQFRAFSN